MLVLHMCRGILGTAGLSLGPVLNAPTPTGSVVKDRLPIQETLNQSLG